MNLHSYIHTSTLYIFTSLFPRPNLIVICVPSLAEIAHLDGIVSIIISTLLGGTLPTRRLIYMLLHLRTNSNPIYLLDLISIILLNFN
jgi:hypothetical protein